MLIVFCPSERKSATKLITLELPRILLHIRQHIFVFCGCFLQYRSDNLDKILRYNNKIRLFFHHLSPRILTLRSCIHRARFVPTATSKPRLQNPVWNYNLHDLHPAIYVLYDSPIFGMFLYVLYSIPHDWSVQRYGINLKRIWYFVWG